jgi:hypothetical protein
MSNINKYEEQFFAVAASLKEDAAKFYEKNNGSAGTRLRKGLIKLKNLATEIRKDIQEIKNKQKSSTKK